MYCEICGVKIEEGSQQEILEDENFPAICVDCSLRIATYLKLIRHSEADES
jgi:ribosome-binding protein aMBF1 (putative translation factor)